MLRRLKADLHTRDIPLIFVSALSETEDESLGLSLGAKDYITKPVRPAIVQARVRAHLQNKLARDLLRDHNAVLEREVSLRVAQYHQVQDVALRALASPAEACDNETGNHILRTQAYTALMYRINAPMSPRISSTIAAPLVWPSTLQCSPNSGVLMLSTG